jgi:hypothetical protein
MSTNVEPAAERIAGVYATPFRKKMRQFLLR